MRVTLAFTNTRARSIKYYLQHRYKSKAELPELIKKAIAEAVADEATTELNKINEKEIK